MIKYNKKGKLIYTYMNSAELRKYLSTDECHELPEEESDFIYELLRKRDPWNNIFHLGCASFPNCDICGCSDADY